METTVRELKHLSILVYTGLTDREIDIKEGDLVNEANNTDQEFTFICWDTDKKYGTTAICKDRNMVRRYFLKDAVKKASSQIWKEDLEIKRQKKAIKTAIQKEKDDLKKAKAEAKRLLEEAKKKKLKYKNKANKKKKK